LATHVDDAVHVALVNMGSTPLRARGVEEALAGGAGAAEAAARAADGTEPTADLNATPDYREHLARVLTHRALDAASS
jgi:aerobic carbon-monoxide dehydrogenase medium subunit